LIYLDDLIIFSRSYEEHLQRLDQVLTKLKSCNLKLAPEKCYFFRSRVSFLGHVVSGDGVETDPAKIEKVKNWPTPANSDELRSFLAFAGYYRRFVKDFSKIIRPFAELLPPASRKKEHTSKQPWKWTHTEEVVFQRLKEILSSPTILAYSDFTQPFELHMNASGKGLGAVLYQAQSGRKRVIAFASRALSRSERNYSAFKLEFLALKWAVTEIFSDYLTMQHFSVLTDNNPLTYVLTTAKLDATGQRWVSALGQFSFDLTYRTGTKNADADSLSRYPHERVGGQVMIGDDIVRAICSSMIPAGYGETLPVVSFNIVESIEDAGQIMAQKELREVRARQREDTLIERWRRNYSLVMVYSY